MRELRRIGVIANPSKQGVLPKLEELIALADKYQFELGFEPRLRGLLGNERSYLTEGCVSTSCDLLLALGGDGTILHAIRLGLPDPVPVLGVHLGSLGFLAEIEPERLSHALGACTRGEYSIEERPLLALSWQHGPEIVPPLALNDLVWERREPGAMVDFRVTYGDAEVLRCLADGLVVATSTGSTGHALSMGGPILHPAVNARIIIPIGAHSLSIRPVVVADDEPIGVEIGDRDDGTALIADGVTTRLPARSRALIRIAPTCARLVRFGPWGFFDVLRAKLRWNSPFMRPRST